VLRAALRRLASICRFEVIRPGPWWPVVAMPEAPSKDLKHQGFSSQKSDNLAAERTGIPRQKERY
jgi:hypothetical protein